MQNARWASRCKAKSDPKTEHCPFLLLAKSACRMSHDAREGYSSLGEGSAAGTLAKAASNLSRLPQANGPDATLSSLSQPPAMLPHAVKTLASRPGPRLSARGAVSGIMPE